MLYEYRVATIVRNDLERLLALAHAGRAAMLAPMPLLDLHDKVQLVGRLPALGKLKAIVNRYRNT